MIKQVQYIAVDPTANMNPYLTIGPTDKLEWGAHRENAQKFDTEREALEAGRAAMREWGLPGAENRVMVEPF